MRGIAAVTSITHWEIKTSGEEGSRERRRFSHTTLKATLRWSRAAPSVGLPSPLRSGHGEPKGTCRSTAWAAGRAPGGVGGSERTLPSAPRAAAEEGLRVQMKRERLLL